MKSVGAHLGMWSLTALLLVGCGDGDPDTEPEPTDAPTTPASSPSPSPSIDPATGPPVETEEATFRLPPGYDVGDDMLDTVTSFGPSNSLVSISTYPSVRDSSLDRLVDVSLNRPFDKEPKRMPDATLDDVEVYHLEGTIDPDTYFAELGADRGDVVVFIQFELELPPAEARQLIESVLATWQWS